MSNGNNFSIEEYYQRIMPELNLISSYLEDVNIKDIIVQCRLKPYLYTSNFTARLCLRKHWVDEFGNSFKLEKKRIKLVINDLSIDKKKVKYTDLYEGLPIDQIAKISKLAYICIGTEDVELSTVKVITLLGVDNYLRTFVEYDGEWRRVSSLCLEIRNLRKIIKNEDIKLWKKLNHEGDVILPCLTKEEWLVCMPVHSQFWEESKIDKKQLNFLEINK